jgi:hypothetical protein
LFKKLLYAVNEYSSIFNQYKPKERYKYLIPIKKAGFTLIEANKLGFNVGKKLWKSNLSLNRNKGGRPGLHLDYKNSIKSYFKMNCTVAPNRYLKLQQENVLYRNRTLKDSFNNFSQNSKISFSAFYKNMPKNVKSPHRLSDLCVYCHLNKVIFVFIYRVF